jgi:hypothetical protein
MVYYLFLLFGQFTVLLCNLLDQSVHVKLLFRRFCLGVLDKRQQRVSFAGVRSTEQQLTYLDLLTEVDLVRAVWTAGRLQTTTESLGGLFDA